MNETALLNNYLVVGAILFGLGMVGVVTRRNMIVMFLAVEMMLQGVSLSLIAWGRFHNDFGGQMLVVFIIAVAACEAAIALAVVSMLYRRTGSLDVALWQELREDNLPPLVDRDVPEPMPDEPAWEDMPKLPPAGPAPEIPRSETDYRRRV